MRKVLSAVALVLWFATVASAQVVGPHNITAVDAGNCATANACVEFLMGSNATLAVDVSGTFSATLAFEASSTNRATWRSITVNNPADGTSATSTTAAGTFVVSNIGFTHVRIRATAYASGTAVLYGTVGHARGGGLSGIAAGGGFTTSTVLRLSGDVTTGADTNPVNLTGIVFTAAPGKIYAFEIIAYVTAAASTSGYGFGLNCAQAPVKVFLTGQSQLANTGTTTTWSAITNNAIIGPTSGIPQNAQETPVHGAGFVEANLTTSGTCQFIFRAETGTGPPTAKAGSMFIVRQL